jgi:hypothetical protein
VTDGPLIVQSDKTLLLEVDHADAAVAADSIARPHGIEESSSDLLQHLVPCYMAEAVIDRLESVKIDEQDAQRICARGSGFRSSLLGS